MTRLIWAVHARADLYAIAETAIEQDLDAYILDRIEVAPLALLDHPFPGEEIRLGVRKWTIRKTPFILLYRADQNAIELLRVVHAATDWRAE